ncbi:hypothetical protein K2173_022619 [Erythroxylum novogranatense]|uniref:DUF7890 domain-containing protein n=1 Tax=Erythroxylum novogranatense TaxID=1862640 RepID=A0AAV8TNK9_9ROSI|nr:hypothetical protein K2173_022619 [Erythroxylum novogranatense]
MNVNVSAYRDPELGVKKIPRETMKGFGKPVYRDELSKKPSYKKKKSGCCLANSQKPSMFLSAEVGNKLSSAEDKGVTRVKVKMTKQEAARLMSKCKDGGVLGFKDVADELLQIPVHRITVMSPSTSDCGSLGTIPEE